MTDTGEREAKHVTHWDYGPRGFTIVCTCGLKSHPVPTISSGPTPICFVALVKGLPTS